MKELAAQIDEAYKGVSNLMVVAILKVAFIFCSDLVVQGISPAALIYFFQRAMSVEHTVEFMSVSSYGAGGTKQGKLQVIMDIRVPIEGKHGAVGA